MINIFQNNTAQGSCKLIQNIENEVMNIHQNI